MTSEDAGLLLDANFLKNKGNNETDDVDTKSNDSVGMVESVFACLQRFSMSMLGYHELIEILPKVIASTTRTTFDRQIRVPVERDCQIISKSDVGSIYRVPAGEVLNLSQSISEYLEVLTGLITLYPSLLLSVVARYESFLTEILAIIIAAHPNRIMGGDAMVSLKDVFASDSLRDLTAKIIDDQVLAISRRNHVDQIAHIEKSFGVAVKQNFQAWTSYCEIFERRNLVAHGDSLANRTYIKNCTLQGVDVSNITVGEKLLVNHEYTSNAVDILYELAAKIAIVLTRKEVKGQLNQTKLSSNALCYDLIKRKRYALAKRILEWEIKEQPKAPSDATHRMALINLANCYKKMGEDAKCSEVLAGEDWSASSDNFAISLASLRGDADRFFQLMERVKSPDSVGLEGFKTWPVFDWMRSDSRYDDKIREIFKEEIESVESLSALSDLNEVSLDQTIQ